MKARLLDLNPNLLNEKIYSPTDLSDLRLSIKIHKQLEPIVINKDNQIISGHRRYYAMIQQGLKECEVRVSAYENDAIALIEHNRHRVKSVQDIINETRILEKELKKKLGGQGSRTDLKGGRKYETVVELSNKTGVSTTKLKKIKSIYHYEPDLLKKIDNKELSVNSAYEIIREKYISKGKKKVNSDKFKQSFRSLLKKYRPPIQKINEVMKTTFPYSLIEISTSDQMRPKLAAEREKLIEHVDFLKSLDEHEIVIYKKLREVQETRLNPKILVSVKDRIWRSTNLQNQKKTISEIEKLDPELEAVRNSEAFDILRILTHSLEWVQNPGRLLRYIVKDKPTGMYLGVITIGSDIASLGSRDEWIGWSRSDRFRKGRLKNTAVASTVVPVQPFGYNFLGGKLMACLTTLETVRRDWGRQYGNILAGLTTTSLYGSFSMYNSIPLWRKVGESKGRIYLKPDNQIFKFWSEWLRKNHREAYDIAVSKTGPKQQVLNLIFKYLGMNPEKYVNEHRKGVYFSAFYKNTKEFLNNRLKESDLVMDQKIEKGLEYIQNWWKPKAIKRYIELKKRDELETEPLWYENINDDFVKSWLNSRGVR